MATCTSCGKPVPAQAKFCKACGATLSQPSPNGTFAPALSPPSTHVQQLSPGNSQAKGASPEPLLENCGACGELTPATSKFCRLCGQPRSSDLAQSAASKAFAPQPAPPKPAPSPSDNTARNPRPEKSNFAAASPFKPSSTSAGRPSAFKYAAVAAVATVALGGLAFGYYELRKHSHLSVPTVDPLVAPPPPSALPPTTSANQASDPSVSSLPPNPSPQDTSTPPTVTPPDSAQAQPNTSAKGNQEFTSSSPGQVNTQPRANMAHRPESFANNPIPPPPKSVPPPYQQAHDNSQQAFAAGRYIEPSDNCALYWARLASQQGDPASAQLESQVFDRMMTLVQSARSSHDYDSAASTLAKLASLFPDHAQIPPLINNIREDQAAYNRQIEQQKKAELLEEQTRQFTVRHRHLVRLVNFKPVYAYCEGTLKVTPDAITRFDCTSTTDPSGRCDHLNFPAGNIQEAHLNSDGTLHLSTRSGKFDFYGDANGIQSALQSSGALTHK
ncbi:MAG: zinc ribbon domain-containing protein [Acidobacteria bacterium]|nr:zinc ribbon domain-containing protein [Acidobacteriota bacterium]MBS1865033.1 zinc ribbon domain-containing protein [Acidobacteriota bacterium]